MGEQVVDRSLDEGHVITEHAYSGVAVGAKETTSSASVVVVVDADAAHWLPTDGAQAPLGFEHRFQVSDRHSVLLGEAIDATLDRIVLSPLPFTVALAALAAAPRSDVGVGLVEQVAPEAPIGGPGPTLNATDRLRVSMALPSRVMTGAEAGRFGVDLVAATRDGAHIHSLDRRYVYRTALGALGKALGKGGL
jgi:hypothetical protein